MTDAMQPDDETRARNLRRWQEKNEPTKTGYYTLTDNWGCLKLAHSSGFDVGEPNRVRLGDCWYKFKPAGRGSVRGGHGDPLLPAVVGIDVSIGGQTVFVSADELEFGRVGS